MRKVSAKLVLTPAIMKSQVESQPEAKQVKESSALKVKTSFCGRLEIKSQIKSSLNEDHLNSSSIRPCDKVINYLYIRISTALAFEKELKRDLSLMKINGSYEGAKIILRR